MIDVSLCPLSTVGQVPKQAPFRKCNVIKEEFYLNTSDPELSLIEIVQQAIDRRNLSDYSLDRIRHTLTAPFRERADHFENRADFPSKTVSLDLKRAR